MKTWKPKKGQYVQWRSDDAWLTYLITQSKPVSRDEDGVNYRCLAMYRRYTSEVTHFYADMITQIYRCYPTFIGYRQ